MIQAEVCHERHDRLIGVGGEDDAADARARNPAAKSPRSVIRSTDVAKEPRYARWAPELLTVEPRSRDARRQGRPRLMAILLGPRREPVDDAHVVLVEAQQEGRFSLPEKPSGGSESFPLLPP